MKKFSPTILLFFIFSTSYSQNYRCIKTNSETYFADPDGFIRAIRIDSMEVDGLDTILFNFNNIIAVDYDCFRTDLGSWIGRPVLIKDNRDIYFFNYYNDSILIRTQADVNESWICYQWFDKSKIVAKVTSVKKDTILGIVDSIKIIELQAVDSLGYQISHDINGWQLKLSKNYGFISMPSFMVFPDFGDGVYNKHHPDLGPFNLIGFTNPETGTTNLTWDEIYNYEPGDEIHTSTYDQGGGSVI